MLVVSAALALTAVAYAGNGGFAPLTPHSPNAKRINDSYVWISIFTGAIFVLVEGALILFIVKYRRRGRPRSAEGPQIHGATRLELIWTAVPILILAAIASFIFYKLPGIQDVPSAKAEGGPLVVQVNAHQFYWQFTYPDGQISIDELHAPVNPTTRRGSPPRTAPSVAASGRGRARSATASRARAASGPTSRPTPCSRSGRVWRS